MERTWSGTFGMLNGDVVYPTISTNNFCVKSGDGNVLPYIATIKTAHTHANNAETPYKLCDQHGNRFICGKCNKFFEKYGCFPSLTLK